MRLIKVSVLRYEVGERNVMKYASGEELVPEAPDMTFRVSFSASASAPSSSRNDFARSCIPATSLFVGAPFRVIEIIGSFRRLSSPRRASSLVTPAISRKSIGSHASPTARSHASGRCHGFTCVCQISLAARMQRL